MAMNDCYVCEFLSGAQAFEADPENVNDDSRSCYFSTTKTNEKKSIFSFDLTSCDCRSWQKMRNSNVTLQSQHAKMVPTILYWKYLVWKNNFMWRISFPHPHSIPISMHGKGPTSPRTQRDRMGKSKFNTMMIFLLIFMELQSSTGFLKVKVIIKIPT